MSLPIWKDIEAAYIAGIVDGEGCIGIYEKCNAGNFIQLTIANTDKGLIDYLQTMLHSNAVKSPKDKRPRNKQSYSVTVDRERAHAVIKRIFPYLRVKNPQASLALRFKAWQNDRCGGYSKEEREVFRNYIATSRQLNKKGSA